MLTFAWPWLFLVLPLPWLARRLLGPVPAGAALRLPSLPETASSEPGHSTGWSPGLAGLAWLLLVAAAARPLGPAEEAPFAASGRSLMLAFDLSASMAAADRLGAARSFADRFLANRRGDRVGLVVFGTQAYLHTPPTFDLEAVRQALAGAEVGLAGRETALGDAIALAVKHLRPLPETERVLILVTDGANTAGTLTPQRAAWLARRDGVRIHGVAIGGAAGEESLRAVAEQTGGTWLRATDAEAQAEFWRRLEGIEPAVVAPVGLRPGRELYPWPLGLALALAGGLLGVRLRREAA